MDLNKTGSGQGAFEYLMTYGWAVIVILIMGATLWYLGIFEVEERAITVSGFSKIRPLAPSILVTPDGNFSGIFVNGAGYVINITNITILNLVGPPRKKCDITNGTGNKREGEAFWIRGNDCVDSPKSQGNPYTLSVNISYIGVVSGAEISRQETGVIHGFYEFHITITTSTVTTTTSTTTTSTSTTSTTSTTTTTTSTTSTTTTSIAAQSVVICGTFYNCGDSDNVCPQDYGISCADLDC